MLQEVATDASRPRGEPERRLWVAVAERGHDARTARPDGEYAVEGQVDADEVWREGAGAARRDSEGSEGAGEGNVSMCRSSLSSNDPRSDEFLNLTVRVAPYRPSCVTRVQV